MNLVLSLFLLLFSFLIVGAITERYFIPSLENISRWLGLSENVAGATLLAFGSSAPELFTALLTLVFLGARPSFGVGNVIGSALFQVLVVIGFAAMVKTTYLRKGPVIRDGVVYGIAVLMLYRFVSDGVFTRLEGAVLVGSYLVYLGALILWSRLESGEYESRPAVVEETNDRQRFSGIMAGHSWVTRPVDLVLKPIPNPARRPEWTLPVFGLCLVIIGVGAWIFVRTGVALAEFLGVDPTLIALTVIAGGSSVPELFASAIVARRGQGDMAVANALGSNTFDIFISLGLPVLIATLLYGQVEDVGQANIVSSTILLLATLAMVLGLLAAQRFKATRPFGALLIFAYLVYVFASFRGWIG